MLNNDKEKYVNCKRKKCNWAINYYFFLPELSPSLFNRLNEIS